MSSQSPIGLRGTAHSVVKNTVNVSYLGVWAVLDADGTVIGYCRKSTEGAYRGWWIGRMASSSKTTDVSRTMARVAANIADRAAAAI